MARKLTLADLTPSLNLEGRRVAVDTQSRRIAVRVANYGEEHSGFGEPVKVPRNANLNAAHVGSAELDTGEHVRVATLPMHTPHAPRDLQALHAASWYENSGTAVARGRYSADEHGVRFDGLLFDDVEESKIDRLTAGSFSGDWRAAIAVKSYGELEHAPSDFVGSCLVNIGGYSDTYRKGTAQRFALVASAAGDFMLIEDATMKDDTPTATDPHALTAAAAAGGGCSDGSCTTCDGSCGGEKTKAGEEPKVVLTASAALALHKAAILSCSRAVSDAARESEIDDLRPAVGELRTALVASGHIDPAAEHEARMARIEQFAVNAIYDQPD